MKMTSNDILSFCQDVNALTQSPCYARRYRFSVPRVGDWILVVDNGNPAAIQVTEVKGQQCTGVVRAMFNTHTLNVGDSLQGTYQEKSSEWRYQNDKQTILVDDYRQCIIDIVQAATWHDRYYQTRFHLRTNNASMNLFLLDTTGKALLTNTTTMTDILNRTKKKGETLFFTVMVINVVLLLMVTGLQAGVVSLWVNAACTLFSLVIWYKDVRYQQRSQKQFDQWWSGRKKDHARLHDMIKRYGLSDNRIRALRQWHIDTLNRLSGYICNDLLPLPNAWCVRILANVNTLNAEDTPQRQQVTLDKIWALTDVYLNDISQYQKKQSKS